MNKFEQVLQRLGILPAFTEDDILNAENDDDLRTHSLVVSKVTAAIERRVHSNQALRRAIDVAKIKTNSFADFERRIGEH